MPTRGKTKPYLFYGGLRPINGNLFASVWIWSLPRIDCFQFNRVFLCEKKEKKIKHISLYRRQPVFFFVFVLVSNQSFRFKIIQLITLCISINMFSSQIVRKMLLAFALVFIAGAVHTIRVEVIENQFVLTYTTNWTKCVVINFELWEWIEIFFFYCWWPLQPSPPPREYGGCARCEMRVCRVSAIPFKLM